MALPRRALLGGLAATAALPACANEASPWHSMDFVGADGQTFRLGAAGKPLTLVKLWASWCGACAGEMASLRTLAAALGARAEILLVSHPEFWDRDRRVAEARKLPFTLATPAPGTPAGLIASAMLTPSGALRVPQSYAFTPSRGAAVWSHLGSMEWDSAGTIAEFKALIA